MKFLSIILVTFMFSCNSKNSEQSELNLSDTTKITKVEMIDTLKVPSEVANKSSWNYSEEDDQMTTSKTFFAVIACNEALSFHSPYDGYNKANLLIRSKRGKTDLILSIDKGQFLSSYEGDKTVNVRFDNSPAKKYAYNNPSDYSSTNIFIQNKFDFLRKLKAANTLKIECEFYDEGNIIMTFDTKGLDWSH